MSTKLEELEAALAAFVADTDVSASDRYDQLEVFAGTVNDHLDALDAEASAADASNGDAADDQFGDDEEIDDETEALAAEGVEGPSDTEDD